VSAGAILGHLQANVAAAKRILAAAIARMPATPDWPEHRSLDGAIMTPQTLWPAATAAALWPLLARFCESGPNADDGVLNPSGEIEA